MKKAIAAMFVALIIGCNEPQPTVHQQTTMETQKPKIDCIKKDFSKLVYDSKKDLVCGMPVTAGIEDTASYKGKLYGFCSSGCKDDFIKNPKQFLTSKK
jgi:YHS domain-containing protein